MTVRRRLAWGILEIALAIGVAGAADVATAQDPLRDSFVRDLLTNTTAPLTDSSPGQPAARRFIAFSSTDSTLVEGDTNDAADIFVLDQLTGAIERVSVDSQANQVFDQVAEDTQITLEADSFDPSISEDGRVVAFASRSRVFDPIDQSSSCATWSRGGSIR